MTGYRCLFSLFLSLEGEGEGEGDRLNPPHLNPLPGGERKGGER